MIAVPSYACRKWVFVLLLWCGYMPLPAQTAHKWGIKLAWMATTDPSNLQLGLEYRYKPNAGIVVQCAYWQHNQQPEDLFSGAASVSYSSIRKTFRYLDYVRPTVVSDWEYVSTTRPFKQYPEQFALSTYDFSVGHATYYRFGQSKWGVALQPSIRGARHSFFRINTTAKLIEDYKDEVVYGEIPLTILETTQFITYKQTREMSIDSKWVFGIKYAVGLRYNWSAHWQITLHTNIGANFSHPYQDDLPLPLRSSWWGSGIEVGYFL